LADAGARVGVSLGAPARGGRAAPHRSDEVSAPALHSVGQATGHAGCGTTHLREGEGRLSPDRAADGGGSAWGGVNRLGGRTLAAASPSSPSASACSPTAGAARLRISPTAPTSL